MSDPQITGKKCSEKEVRALVDDMLEGTRAYLPDGWF